MCAGRFHSLALTTDNELFSWGFGDRGRLGINSIDTKGDPQKVIFIDRSGKVPGENDVSHISDRSVMEMYNNLGGVEQD